MRTREQCEPKVWQALKLKYQFPPPLQEMAAYEQSSRGSARAAAEEREAACSETGHSSAHCSKEGTPVAHSSKEGTPGPSDESVCSYSGSRAGGAKVRDKISFMCGNPSVDVTHGILHLYKQNTPTPLSPGLPRPSTLCLLSVPPSVTTHDLLHFTAPCHGDIQHLRIIRDASSPNAYMVLITFRTQV